MKKAFFWVASAILIGAIVYFYWRFKNPKPPQSFQADYGPTGQAPANIFPLKIGSKGPVVEDAQRWVNRALTASNWEGEFLNPDGIYGPNTEARVKDLEEYINRTLGLNAFTGFKMDGQISKAEFDYLKKLYE